MKKLSQISILSDVKYIPLAINYLSGLCNIIGMSQRELVETELAIEVALLSTIKNAFPDDPNQEINIVFELDGTNFIISIRNKGLPYLEESTNALAVEMDDEALQDKLGLKIVQGLVDSFTHCVTAFDGQELRLTKSLEKRPDFNETGSSTTGGSACEYSFKSRMARKEDLIKVVRCIYDEYGYTYLRTCFYNVEQLAAKIDAGEVHTAVSVTNTGEVASTMSLFKLDDFPKLMDIGVAAVKRRFRKRGQAKALAALLMEKAKALPINGVFVECVTHHSASQKIYLGEGFTPLAFNFSCGVVNTSFDLPEDFRLSDALAIKYYDISPSTEIYPPVEHEEFIQKIYNSIPAKVSFLKEDYTASAPISEIKFSYSALDQSGFIRIASVGADIDRAIKSSLLSLRMKNAEKVCLYIDMLSPSCPFVFEAAKNNGFIFTGILPNTGNGEMIIMNHLMGKGVDYDSIKTFGEFENILAYIKAHDQTII